MEGNSVTLLRHVSLLSAELTPKERLRICCKPSFRWRRLKSKGAILVLIWNYLCVSVLFFYRKLGGGNLGLTFSTEIVVFGVTLSIAGWIADVRFGRYRVIYLSMWIMWAAIMLVAVISVVTQVLNSDSKVIQYVSVILWIAAAIGLGGFLANVIQFGIVQLHDASSSEVTLFIFWYVWTYYSSPLVVDFVIGCLPNQYRLIGNLVTSIYLSIVLSSMLMFNHWLVKEPVTQNPFKLVYSVVRYAIKHEHPEYRSAFTYCEDEPPSRIDFGKRKYGGPFTTEQVEDVKTFLRVMVIVFTGVVIFGVTFATRLQILKLLDELTDPFSKCYSKGAFVDMCFYGCVILLPLHELLIYPVIHRCSEVIESGWIIVCGSFLLLTEILSVLVIETVARYEYLDSTGFNATIPCMGRATLGTSLDFRWIAVPILLHSMSTYLLGIGAVKFMVSQAPYSMRGLIMGTAYCMFALCVAVWNGIYVPFTRQLSIWGTRIISCGFWYALLLLVVEVLAGFMLIALLRWYKKRKREDVLPNDHIFAERYYGSDS